LLTWLGVHSFAFAGLIIDPFTFPNPGVTIDATGTTEFEDDSILGRFRVVDFVQDDILDDVRVGLLGGTNPRFAVSNGSTSSSTATVTWDADGNGLGGLDLTAGGNNSLYLADFGREQTVTLTFTVNGTSSVVRSVDFDASPLFVNFAEFSDPGVFTSVNSIALEVGGDPDFDTSFREFGADFDPSAIPEPSAFALLGLGCVGLLLCVRRRRAKQKVARQ
jgi:hypothetical protein